MKRRGPGLSAVLGGILVATLAIACAGPAWGSEEVARRSGCLECHAVDRKVSGPAFHDVAVRYKGDARARGVLVQKVKRGGKGNWTEITGGKPMPPFSRRLSDAEIARLVDWVLGR